ncbi:MAG: hypothetical protein PGN29_04265 [Gordonia paraffinivorans]
MTFPSPAQMPGSRPVPGATVSTGSDVDPTELTAQIAEITDLIDGVAAEATGDPDDTEAVGARIAALDATADLVDRAHGLLTDALDRLDRV